MNLAELRKEAAELQNQLVELRRELHQIPEFALMLPKTQAKVRDVIAELGEVHPGDKLSSLVLVIRGDLPGETVLLRSDMDALAINEVTELPFKATNGFMHACGHDLHMAMAVGAARLLAAHKHELRGSVVIWFQPGEEGHGGADLMLAENSLRHCPSTPVAAFGLHVFSHIPTGLFATRAGALMAAAGGVTVTVSGKGGHGSSPWLAKDPISPLIEMAQGIQTIVTKKFSAFEPVIVNLGWIKAGDSSTSNVIPETASFGATIRTFDRGTELRLQSAMREYFAGVAAAHQVEVCVEFDESTKVLVNDSASTAIAQQTIEEMFGEQRFLPLSEPIAGAEDFASIAAIIPSTFIFLGAEPALSDGAINHSNRAVFDEGPLSDGAALLAALAIKVLNR